jgi:hypothetical protein
MSFYDLLRNLPDQEVPQEPTQEGPEPESIPEPAQQPSNSADNWKQLSDVVPQGWRPEKEFASSEEALQFYAEKYNGLWQHLNSEEFASELERNYGDALASREQEIESFKEMLNGFKSDPLTFMASYVPEYAEQLGIGKMYTEAEMDQVIEERIAEEFGDNWRDVYNPADLVKPSSISARIARYSQKAGEDLIAQNQTIEQKRKEFLANLQNRNQQTNVPAQVDMDAQADSLVDAYFEEGLAEQVSEEEFLELIQESMNRPMKLTDVYRTLRFDQILEREREAAREEGRKAMMEEMRKAGKMASAQFQPQSTSSNKSYEENPPTILGLRVR